MKRIIGEVGRIQAIARKYLKFFYLDGPVPEIEIVDHPISGWLARTSFTADTLNTHIKIQRVAVSNPTTLKRVLAHEVVHHVDMMKLQHEQENYENIYGKRWSAHGQSFNDLMCFFNSRIGKPNFVTPEGGPDLTLAPWRAKSIWLLVGRQKILGSYEYGWMWTRAMTSVARKIAESYLGIPGLTLRLLKTSDLTWAGNENRLEDLNSIPLVPADEEYQIKLRGLYEKTRDFGPSRKRKRKAR